MAKISIVGWYGEGNIGDESFRSVFEQEWGAKHELVFAQTPQLDCDLIVYGGGGVVGGNYLNALPKNRLAVAVGVDIPLNGAPYERMQQYNFARIYTRSKEYAFLANSQGLQQVQYCPDLAFALARPSSSDYVVAATLLQAAGPLSTKCLVGVNISCDLPAHQVSELAYALDQLNQQYQVVLFSVYDGTPGNNSLSDASMAQTVAAQMKTTPFIIGSIGSPQIAVALMSLFSKVISMRFHGCIFAALAGITFYALSRRGKHSLFCEQSGLSGYFVDLSEFSGFKLIQALQLSNPSTPILKDATAQNSLAVRTTLEQIESDYLTS